MIQPNLLEYLLYPTQPQTAQSSLPFSAHQGLEAIRNEDSALDLLSSVRFIAFGGVCLGGCDTDVCSN